jgi:hypothetical protein
MKKSVLFLMGLVCLFLTVSGAAWAQETGKISGTLSDSLTGKPIEYATVALLQPASTQAVQSTLTDATGRFSFLGVPSGTYQLAISFLGYQKRFIGQVTVRADRPETTVGNLKLVPATTQLKEVTVEALRPTITQEADRMVVSIEGTALAAGRTAYDVLATSPGVFIDQDGNIQLNGRAGVTIMLDGKLTYLSARDLRSLLEGMSAENIRNIEIITNPSSKYDAEGSSGILNINLKKNTLQGVNGSTYAGANYNGKQYGFSTGGSVNYRTGPWNSFLNLDMSRRVGGRDATFNRVFRTGDSATYFDQVATGNFKVQGPPAIRVGTDYSFNDRHSVGAMSYFSTNQLHADFLTETFIGQAPNQPAQFIDADNFNQNRFTNMTSNLHYMGTYDTLGTTLTADLDFVKIKNRGDANFYNYFYDLESGSPATQDFLYTDTPNEFDIFAAKIDFTKPLAQGRKLELGAKASRVVSDNDSRFYFNNDNVLLLDERRTNHFVYQENILAGYVNLNSKLGERLSVQSGLRAEYTRAKGESFTTKDINRPKYLNLFPSLFVQQHVSDNYQINYNYSRRIQRPNYGQLNPFFAYRDPYTYWQGNPELRPQYTHAIGVTQVFKKTYNLVFNYQQNYDVIAELPEVIPETSTTIYYVGNVPKSRNLSLTAIVPFTVMKNWESNNTLLVSYSEFSAVVNKQQVINDQVFYMLQSNQTIMLPKKIRMEVNGTYQGPGVYALYVVDPRWWVNVGLKKNFMQEKLDLSINANDIFKTQDLIISALVGEGNVSDWNQYFRQRNIGFTLRYKFSKGEKPEERKRSTLEELNRTGN